MAITQDRMMALITAARQCKDCAIMFQRFISAEIKHLPANPTLDEALSLIRAIQTLSLTNNIPMEAGEIIAREEEHFRLMATRNRRSAAYARRRRGTSDGALTTSNPELLGLKSPTAPLTLDRFKHADLQSIVQPHPSHPNQTQHQPAAWTADDDLIQHKAKINEVHAAMKMKQPYSPDDLYDPAVPIHPDHYQFLGLPRPETDDSLF